MSLITLTNDNQSPYQFNCKFSSGSLKLPRDATIGLLHFKAERDEQFVINNTNDTFIWCQGLHSFKKLANTTNHIDVIPPMVCKLRHGVYTWNNDRNMSPTTGMSINNDNYIVPEIMRAINENNIFGGVLYTGQLIHAPETGSPDRDRVLQIKGYQVRKIANTNICLKMINYPLFNDGSSTLTYTDDNTSFNITPSIHSNLFISKNNLTFVDPSLNNALTSHLTAVGINFPEIGRAHV